MNNDRDYTFVCPECGESLSVDGSMRDALIDEGCLFCGTNVSKAAFVSA